MSKRTSLLLISLLLLTTVHANDTPRHPDPEVMDILEEEHPDANGRLLSSGAKGYPFRMNANYDNIDSTSLYRNYFQSKLIPPILDYFTHALTLRAKLTNGINFSDDRTTYCNGYTLPQELKVGLATDFYWILDYTAGTGSWVASSGSCYLTSSSKRPYIASTKINTNLFGVPIDGAVLLHEKNTICIMHELTHNLGFADNMFKYFIDVNGNTLTGHVTTQTLDGDAATVLNIEPLTSMLRTHFGCPTLIGAYMENDGGDATEGSHFERRHFGFEYMTSGLIYEMQISKFALAFFEGTGWYYPDYTYADNFSWGQGQGCDFLFKSCSDPTFSFDEFCTDSSIGCSVPGSSGGSCIGDPRADGCRFYKPDRSYHCEDPTASSSARLPNLEVFGRGLGSKCVRGTLSTSSASAAHTAFCFNYKCENSGANTILNIAFGSKTISCTAAGSLSVNGYLGHIDCPDPVKFCNTVGVKTCPRGCMGRGTCTDGSCVCNTGYTGTDCGLSA